MSFLYSIFILPIEFIYKYIYLFCTMLTNSYGIGLLVLSVISSIAFLPLARFALSCQAKEREFHAVVAPQMKAIKENFSGKERNDAVNRLYKRYAYHPIMGIRSAFGVLLQVPFLTGAYYMISTLEEIKGHSFLCIPDLSQPDGLLFGLNLLPILMTIINVGVVFTTKGLQRKDIIQALVIATFFLVLLYPAPSALLIFWTMNNLLFLLQNIIKTPACFSIFLQKNPTPYCQRISSFVILLFLAPVFFIWAINAHMYTVEMLTCGFLTLALFYLIPLFIFGTGIDFFLLRAKKTIIQKTIITITVAIFTYLVLRYITPYKELFSTKIAINTYFAITILAFVFLATKFSLKFINVFFACILALSIGHFSYNKIVEGNISVKYKSDITADLKHTPNIYWIYLESYHDIDTMKRVYGIDSNNFISDLQSLGFTYYPHILSNAPATTVSLYTVFTMQPYFSKISKGNLDVLPDAMSVLLGNLGNNLFGYVQQQGYKTISTIKSFYHSTQPVGTLLDYCYGYNYNKCYTLLDKNNKDFSFFYTTSSEVVLHSSFPRLSKSINKINKFIGTNFLKNNSVGRYRSYPLNEKVASILNLTQTIKTPKFTFMDGGVFHSPSDGTYTWRQAAEWIESGKYKNAVLKSNNDIIKAMDLIQQNDPNAIIVLMGDHGSWSLRDLQKGKTFDEIIKNLEATKYTLSDLVHDQYGIFLAVKMPKDMKQDISFDLPLSPANIFRHVFAAINNDKAILDTRVESISSTTEGVILARDGKVLPEEKEE